MATETNLLPLSPVPEAQEILDALSTGVLLLDSELRVLDANLAAENLLGMSAHQARGRLLRDLCAHQELWQVLTRAAVNSDNCSQREVTLQAAHAGEERVTDVSVSPLDPVHPAGRLLVELNDATPAPAHQPRRLRSWHSWVAVG